MMRPSGPRQWSQRIVMARSRLALTRRCEQVTDEAAREDEAEVSKAEAEPRWPSDSKVAPLLDALCDQISECK